MAIKLIPVIHSDLTPVKTFQHFNVYEIRGDSTHAGKRGTEADIRRLLGYAPDIDIGQAILFQTGNIIRLD